MPSCRCSPYVVWFVVIALFAANCFLLLQYHSAIDAATGRPKVHTNDLNPKAPNAVGGAPSLSSSSSTSSMTSAAPRDDVPGTPAPPRGYAGPVVNGRVQPPNVEPSSLQRRSNVWGRFLAQLKVTAEDLSSSSSPAAAATDVVDVLVGRTVPVRYWRLDPLVPGPARDDAAKLHAQDAAFSAASHRVKHQASALHFRWPWHLSHFREKLTRVWAAAADERAAVSQRVFTAWSKAAPSVTPARIDELLRDNDFVHFPSQVADEIESILGGSGAGGAALPLFAKQILASRLRARRVFINTGCNVVRVPFTSPDEDEACTRYLGDVKNWKALKPLPTRYDARTIKFQVEFSEPDLHSVLKVPQRLFPYEAFAEIGAYHADRVLGVRRIAPTAYVCIPKEMIRAAVKQHGATVETDEETLKDSKVQTYAEWVEKDLLSFAERSAYNRDDRGSCVGASIQPLMADVHHLLDTALALPYKTHDRGWHDYFNFSGLETAAATGAGGGVKARVGPYGEAVKPDDMPVRFTGAPYAPTVLHTAELVAFDFVVGNNDRSPNKNFFVVGPCVDQFQVCSEDETAFFNVQEKDEQIAGEDAALVGGGANAVRLKSNTNANGGTAAAGAGGAAAKTAGGLASVEQVQGFDWKQDKSPLRRPGPPTFIHIDQGMAFYQTPTDNALTKALKQKDPSAFCLFRRGFVNRLLDLFGAEPETLASGAKESFADMVARVALTAAGDDDNGRNGAEADGGGFAKIMLSRVPPPAMHSQVLSREHFAACERRMRKVLLQLSRCLSKFPVEVVVAP